MKSGRNLQRMVSLCCLWALGAAVFAAEGSAGPTPDKPARPRLIDLGADKCIPCKMMAPILVELGKEYAGQLDVVFIDVWKKREEGARYGIRLIPTQIFLDAAGVERFRHEGFYAKQDILSKWAALGVNLKPPVADAAERAKKP